MPGRSPPFKPGPPTEMPLQAARPGACPFTALEPELLAAGPVLVSLSQLLPRSPRLGSPLSVPFPGVPTTPQALKFSLSAQIPDCPFSLSYTCPLAELWALNTGGQGGLRVWLEGMTSPCSQQALCAFTLGSVRQENGQHLWPLRGEGGREKGNPGWTTVGCFLSLTAGSAQAYEAVG